MKKKGRTYINGQEKGKSQTIDGIMREKRTITEASVLFFEKYGKKLIKKCQKCDFRGFKILLKGVR